MLPTDSQSNSSDDEHQISSRSSRIKITSSSSSISLPPSENTELEYNKIPNRTCNLIPYLINNEYSKLTGKYLHSNLDEKPCGPLPMPEILEILPDKSHICNLVSTIREVDNKLNHITVQSKIENVLIVTKLYDLTPVLATIKLLHYILVKSESTNIFIQDKLTGIKQFKAEFSKSKVFNFLHNRIKLWSETDFTGIDNSSKKYTGKNFDLVITLGGDGTILYTNWLFQRQIPPLLCFSLGTLGFLTLLDFKNYPQIISDIFENGYKCSIRSRFECIIMKSIHENVASDRFKWNLQNEIRDPDCTKSHRVYKKFTIFNDVVVDRGPNSKMTSLDLYSNRRKVTNIEADGCIIATPSGSTAYSLSAGGLLVHPLIPAMLVSPICAHSLSFRPLVVPDSTVLKIGVPYDARTSAWCAFDGNESREKLDIGDYLVVVASKYPVAFIRDTSSDEELQDLEDAWFKRLSDTLHWNERKRQTAYTL